MLAAELKLPFRRDAVERILREGLNRGRQPNLQLCGSLGAMLGLHVSGVRVPSSQGTRLETPGLVSWKGSFAIVQLSNAQGIVLASPREGWVELSPEQIQEEFPEGIEMLLLERSSSTPEQRFGFSWFWPALRRYRGLLIQVLLASFVVQLFSLANPLLIQVIIDKVISQRSLDTLQVLGIALVVVTLMEGVIGSLRTFLFSETTNRIDLRLGAEVIDHLLRLPLSYFDRRPVGELGTRIAEMEKIRNFLTGQALTTLLGDLCGGDGDVQLGAHPDRPLRAADSGGAHRAGRAVVPASVSRCGQSERPHPEPLGGGAERYPDGEGPERGDDQPLEMAGLLQPVHRPHL
jgi:subfamily B ATP-binding cassette protein HlyB/CyaB